MEDKFSSKKFPNFVCNCCDYTTSRKSQYDRHLLTLKHKKKTFVNQEDKKVPHVDFICKCGIKYTSRQGLWKHLKICKINKSSESSDSIIGAYEDDSDKSELKVLTELVKDVIKHNQELTNKIIDICQVGQTQNNTISHSNVHSNNKTFNLQFFLNETCKDAMNISDFVSSIKLNLEDLENTGRKGYVEGISNIFLKNLNNIEDHMRPIHCSDQKREILYIKDNDKWEKECEDKPILTKAIKNIANQNIKQIQNWRDKNPDCTASDSRKNDLYLKIVSNSMNGLTEEEGKKNINKIISNVAKEVVIDKS